MTPNAPPVTSTVSGRTSAAEAIWRPIERMPQTSNKPEASSKAIPTRRIAASAGSASAWSVATIATADGIATTMKPMIPTKLTSARGPRSRSTGSGLRLSSSNASTPIPTANNESAQARTRARAASSTVNVAGLALLGLAASELLHAGPHPFGVATALHPLHHERHHPGTEPSHQNRREDGHGQHGNRASGRSGDERATRRPLLCLHPFSLRSFRL